jgi:hypothetical protein
LAAKVEEDIRRLILPEIRKTIKEETADLRSAMDERFKATATQISDLRVTVDERLKGVEARINAVNERIDGLHGAFEMLKLMPRLVELERKVATLGAKASS